MTYTDCIQWYYQFENYSKVLLYIKVYINCYITYQTKIVHKNLSIKDNRRKTRITLSCF